MASESISRLPPTDTYWSTKCVILTSIAGTVAITAVVLGILALFKVSAFSQFGSIGGISLTAGGGIALLILIIVSTVRSCRSQEKMSEAPSKQQKMSEAPSKILQIQTEPQPKINEKPIKEPEPEKKTDPAPVKELKFKPTLQNPGACLKGSQKHSQDRLARYYSGPVWQQAAQKLGITDPLQRIKEIYGDEMVNFSHEKSDDATVYQAAIYLMSDQEISDLTLSTIDNLTYKQKRALHHRLGYFSRPLGDDPKEETLGAFWQEEIQAEDASFDRLPDHLYLLSAQQILNLLADESIGKKEVDQLLPDATKTCESDHFTRKRLLEIGKAILPYINKLPTRILFLLSPDIFESPDFPWKCITEELFSGSSDRIQAIVEKMPIQRFKELAPKLPVSCLSSLPKNKLEDQQFPWSIFIQKEGIGRALHLRMGGGFQPIGFPWAELAAKPDEIKALFKLGKGYSNDASYIATRNLINAMDRTDLLLVAPHLTLDHFPLLKALLNETLFPWKCYIDQKGIGKALRGLDVLGLPHFPLAQLASHKEEVESLFDLGSSSSYDGSQTRKETERLFGLLNRTQLGLVAPALTIYHLPLLKKRQFFYKDFPWAPFLAKKGIGGQLHHLDVVRGQYLPKAVVDNSDYFPWQELIKYPDEVTALFQLPPSGVTSSSSVRLLKELSIEAVTILAPYLTREHLTRLDENLFKSEKFPWAPFLDMDGIGYSLSQLELHKFPHFPWDSFLTKTKEVSKLFDLGSTSAGNARMIYKNLHPTIQQKIVAALPHLKGII